MPEKLSEKEIENFNIKDTDKYPRRLREKFATFIGLSDEKALFLKKEGVM